MLNRTQLLLLTAMATLGGSFAGLLVVGMLAGDVTLAIINLCVIVALFSSVFVIGSGSGDKPAKKLEDDSLSRDIYLQAMAQRAEYSRLSEQVKSLAVKDLTGANGERAHKLAREKFFGERLDEKESRRAGDQNIGGEVLPEFK